METDPASEKQLIYYLHVHKAGGKSFVRLAGKNGARVYTPSFNGNPHYHHAISRTEFRIPFWEWSAAEQEAFLLSGPHTLVCNEWCLGAWFPEHPRIRTAVTLRDPLDRAYSNFRAVQRRGNLDRALAFHDFIQGAEVLPWWMSNRTVAQFSVWSGLKSRQPTEEDLSIALDRLGRFDTVLVLERDYTEAVFRRAFGWEIETASDAHVDHGSGSLSDARSALRDHPAALARLADLNRLDLALYDAAVSGPKTGSVDRAVRSGGASAPQSTGQAHADRAVGGQQTPKAVTVDASRAKGSPSGLGADLVAKVADLLAKAEAADQAGAYDVEIDWLETALADVTPGESGQPGTDKVLRRELVEEIARLKLAHAGPAQALAFLTRHGMTSTKLFNIEFDALLADGRRDAAQALCLSKLQESFDFDVALRGVEVGLTFDGKDMLDHVSHRLQADRPRKSVYWIKTLGYLRARGALGEARKVWKIASQLFPNNPKIKAHGDKLKSSRVGFHLARLRRAK